MAAPIVAGTRQFILTLTILVGLCGMATADTGLRDSAREVIVTYDRIARQMKALGDQKPPAGVSRKHLRAWQEMTWKAAKVRSACLDIIKYAECIERGDVTQRTMERLSTAMHKFRLAWNEFEEKMEALKRIQMEES